MEEPMRGLGTVLLTGAVAVVVWKVLLSAVAGLLGIALKVALVFLVVYFLMKIFRNNKKED
jgi:predicted membrane protein